MLAMPNPHSISLTELRGKLYQLIDQTIATGIPIEIERKGHLLKISLENAPSKMDRLIKRSEIIAHENDDLIHADWMKNWDAEL
ncbi:MAG: type II toxin-antitoxin system Phd/YefM family antitoxin [Pseudomonadota bacterium]